MEHKYKLIKKKLKREKEVTEEQTKEIKELMGKQQAFETQVNNDKIIDELSAKIVGMESQVYRADKTISEQSQKIQKITHDFEQNSIQSD